MNRFAYFVLGVVAGFLSGLLVLSMRALYLGAHDSDQLIALSALAGGLIGAGGTAAAVYLTLDAQRKDDATKVEAALRMEVSEFARLVLGHLDLCEKIVAGILALPMNKLPVVMSMPDPAVYRATADRISRLHYGSLFVTFHTRIAEFVALATALAATSNEIDGHSPNANESTARLLGEPLLDVCRLARRLLRPNTIVRRHAEELVTITLSDLDAAHQRAGKIFDLADEQGTPTAD